MADAVSKAKAVSEFEWLRRLKVSGLTGLKANRLTDSQSCGQIDWSSIEQVFC